MRETGSSTFLQIDPESPSSFLIGHQAGEGGAFLHERALTAAPGSLEDKNTHTSVQTLHFMLFFASSEH